jgi:spore coat protein U-like protein
MKNLFPFKASGIRWGMGLFLGLSLLLPGHAGADCSVTATDLRFGSYDLFARTPNAAVGTLTVFCNEAPPADVAIQISPGSGPDGFTPRRMQGPAGDSGLDYNVFTDPAMTTIWGDGTGSTASVFLKNVTKNKSRSVNVYGIIFPGQNVPSGAYGDALTATITW